MANLAIKPANEKEKFVLEKILSQEDFLNNSPFIINLNTENKFIDKDIQINLDIPRGEITSGTAHITNHSITYNSDNGNFDITGQANISEPVPNIEGYIGPIIGTAKENLGGAVLESTINKITIGIEEISNISTEFFVSRSAPSSSIINYIVAEKINEVPTEVIPTDGLPYAKIKLSNRSSPVTITPRVIQAGYGDLTNYNISEGSVRVGQTNKTYYIPIKVGTIKSGSASIISESPEITYVPYNNNFKITSTVGIEAPEVEVEGYIGNTVGTKQAREEELEISLDKIELTTEYNYIDDLLPPGEELPTSSGTIYTEAPTLLKTSSEYGVDIQVSRSSISGKYNFQITAVPPLFSNNLLITPKVAKEGYGTPEENESLVNTTRIEVRSKPAIGFISLDKATITSSSLYSSESYEDISSEISVSSSNILYINHGYITNSKFSISNLISNATYTGEYERSISLQSATNTQIFSTAGKFLTRNIELNISINAPRWTTEIIDINLLTGEYTAPGKRGTNVQDIIITDSEESEGYNGTSEMPGDFYLTFSTKTTLALEIPGWVDDNSKPDFPDTQKFFKVRNAFSGSTIALNGGELSCSNETNNINISTESNYNNNIQIKFKCIRDKITPVLTTPNAGVFTQGNHNYDRNPISSITSNFGPYYINGVTLTKPDSGTSQFDITVPNGENDTITYHFSVDTQGNTIIT